MRNYSQDALVEQSAIALLARLGYETINAFREKPGKGSTARLNPGMEREATNWRLPI